MEGERYTAEAGVQMARAATETQGPGLTGLEFGLAIPGTVGGAVWANAGAHDADVAGVLESAGVLPPTAPRRSSAAADLGFGYRDSRFKHAVRAGRSPATSSSTPRSASSRADPELIKDPARRHPPLAPGAPAARDAVRRQRVPQPAGRLGRAADRRGRAQGHPDRRCGRVARSTRTSSSTTRRGRRRTSGDWPSGSGRGPGARRASTLDFEVEFVGDWSAWEAAA